MRPDAIVVLHPGALGDVLLAVPALRALREGALRERAVAARPEGARLVLAAQPRIGELLVALGVVDEALSFETLGLHSLFVEDEPRRIDALADAARVVSWFGAGNLVFERRLTALAPGAVIAPPAGEGRFVWRHLLESVGAKTSAHYEPIVVPRALVDAVERALRDAGWDGVGDLLVVHPGAGGASKRWRPSIFAEAVLGVAETRHVAIVLHRGPADAEAVDALRASLGDQRAIVLDAPALPALAGVLARARGYLGNDSGVSHLAAAVGAPSVILFVEAMLRWQPWSPTAWCLTRSSGKDLLDTLLGVLG